MSLEPPTWLFRPPAPVLVIPPVASRCRRPRLSLPKRVCSLRLVSVRLSARVFGLSSLSKPCGMWTCGWTIFLAHLGPAAPRLLARAGPDGESAAGPVVFAPLAPGRFFGFFFVVSPQFDHDVSRCGFFCSHPARDLSNVCLLDCCFSSNLGRFQLSFLQLFFPPLPPLLRGLPSPGCGPTDI